MDGVHARCIAGTGRPQNSRRHENHIASAVPTFTAAQKTTLIKKWLGRGTDSPRSAEGNGKWQNSISTTPTKNASRAHWKFTPVGKKKTTLACRSTWPHPETTRIGAPKNSFRTLECGWLLPRFYATQPHHPTQQRNHPSPEAIPTG